MGIPKDLKDLRRLRFLGKGDIDGVGLIYVPSGNYPVGNYYVIGLTKGKQRGYLANIYGVKEEGESIVRVRPFIRSESESRTMYKSDEEVDLDAHAEQIAIEFAQQVADANSLPFENRVRKMKGELEKIVFDKQLEKSRRKSPIFILSTLAGLALTIYSSNSALTGHAISNVSNVFQNSQGLLGIFLFVFGLAGLVFSFRRK